MHILRGKQGKEDKRRGKSEECFAVESVRRCVDDGQSIWRWRVRIQDSRIQVLRYPNATREHSLFGQV